MNVHDKNKNNKESLYLLRCVECGFEINTKFLDRKCARCESEMKIINRETRE